MEKQKVGPSTKLDDKNVSVTFSWLFRRTSKIIRKKFRENVQQQNKKTNEPTHKNTRVFRFVAWCWPPFFFFRSTLFAVYLRSKTVKSLCARVWVSSEMARHAISIGRTFLLLLSLPQWFGVYFGLVCRCFFFFFSRFIQKKKCDDFSCDFCGYFGAVHFNRIKFDFFSSLVIL